MIAGLKSAFPRVEGDKKKVSAFPRSIDHNSLISPGSEPETEGFGRKFRAIFRIENALRIRSEPVLEGSVGDAGDSIFAPAILVTIHLVGRRMVLFSSLKLIRPDLVSLS